MTLVTNRMRRIGWFATLGVCAVLFIALTFRVHAVKSEVQLAERRIVALERERMLLETEFQTRASQQQLADWNALEFGYGPPEATQYLPDERELAALAAPRAPGAPEPIRVARSDEEALATLVSPMTGKPLAPREAESDAKPASSLADRLARPELVAVPETVDEVASDEDAEAMAAATTGGGA